MFGRMRWCTRVVGILYDWNGTVCVHDDDDYEDDYEDDEDVHQPVYGNVFEGCVFVW